MSNQRHLTKNQLNRLPAYLEVLYKLKEAGVLFISSQTIADCLKMNNEKVRKDIALVSTESGVPNKGRDIEKLIEDIETLLGYKKRTRAIIVGVGSLGKALLRHRGFDVFGLKVVAGFDIDETVIGKEYNGKKILDFNELNEKYLLENDISIAILTVPEYAAQSIADELCKFGIGGIWNFSTQTLTVPQDVVVSNVNLAASLAELSHKLYLKEIDK